MAEDTQGSPADDKVFNEFYTEVKEIEKRDSVLTSKQQIERLTRPGATYFNLNPFDVLQIDPDAPWTEVKQRYKQMSLLLHPDKNIGNEEKAKTAFDALSMAYKTLENEEGCKRCKEIVEEAKTRVDEALKTRRKQLKKEGKGTSLPEDDPDKYKHAVYVQTCKLFADLERLRRDQAHRESNEQKRKFLEEQEEKEAKKAKAEWDKNYDESRSQRVESWRGWNQVGKKAKGTFKPPKPKMQQR